MAGDGFEQGGFSGLEQFGGVGGLELADEGGGDFGWERAEGLDYFLFGQGFEESACGGEVAFDEFSGEGLEALGFGHGVIWGGA